MSSKKQISKKERKKSPGRPKKYDIDTEEIVKLSSFGCTNTEMASFFGCSPDLLEKSYSDYIVKGKDQGKRRLRKLQWHAAEKGNVVMLIWLGKQYLGQSDKQEVTHTDLPEGFNVELI